MSWPSDCLFFLKNPLVVRYQHRSVPVVLHTRVMLKLFTCAVGHCYHDHHHCVSTGVILAFHTGSSHVPSTLPQRLSRAEWNSPLKSLNKRHLAYSYSCSLGLGGGGWITNWSHLQVLAPRGACRNIFFVFCCFVLLFFVVVFLVAWTGWPSLFCLEALVLLYHLPCWVMIKKCLGVCYKLLFVDITSLLKWRHSPIQTGHLSINVVQRLIQTFRLYVHSVIRMWSLHGFWWNLTPFLNV